MGLTLVWPRERPAPEGAAAAGRTIFRAFCIFCGAPAVSEADDFVDLAAAADSMLLRWGWGAALAAV